MARSYELYSVVFMCGYDFESLFVFWPVRFVRVEQLKEKLLKSNDQTEWVPDYVKVGIRRDQYSEYILLVRFLSF